MTSDPERGSAPGSRRRVAVVVLRGGVTLAIGMAVVQRVWLEKEKLAAYHYRINCRRSDWQHKTTTSLAKKYELRAREKIS